MTSDFIQSLIRRRMEVLGFGENHTTEMRTMNIPAGVSMDLPLWNVYLYVPSDLLDPASGLRIESNFGVLDYGANHRFSQHEHTGMVTITNPGPQNERLTFIAAIPGHPNRH